MSPISPCSCLRPIHWSQVLSQEWRCSWSSAERWCSNYIWMISQFIVYLGVPYIRGLMVDGVSIEMHLKILSVFCQLFCSGPSVSRGSVAGDVMAREVPKSPYFDSAWWRHQMETFSALLALCERNPPVTGGFHSQRPVTESFDVFLDLHLNKRLNKQSRCLWFEMPSCSLWLQRTWLCWHWGQHKIATMLQTLFSFYWKYCINIVFHRYLFWWAQLTISQIRFR